MISYLSHDEINKSLWDECIDHAPNGIVYAYSWYLDIVHPRWEALVEIKEDKYLTVMPITKKKKYGVSYLCQPFFVQQLGVFSWNAVAEHQVKEFLKAIPKKYRLVEIRLNEGNPLEPALKGVEFHRNHLLELDYDYDTLLSNYHENTRRNLKKSLKYGLRLVTEVSIETVIALFRNNRGASVTHWGDVEYERLSRLAHVAISSSDAFIYGVKTLDNDEIICGALFVVGHGRITFLFSGNNAVGKQTQAMTFMIDAVVHEFSGRQMTLDFEGSDDMNLARYYQGFGSTPVVYPSFSYRFCNPLR